MIRLDNTDALFSDVLTGDEKCGCLGDRLDHLWIQEVESISTTWNSVRHGGGS